MTSILKKKINKYNYYYKKIIEKKIKKNSF